MLICHTFFPILTIVIVQRHGSKHLLEAAKFHYIQIKFLWDMKTICGKQYSALY